MSRPINKKLRKEILNAFNNHLHRTQKEIEEHLRDKNLFVSYQATRRMLRAMVNEGLLTILPQRGEKNALVFMKVVFVDHAQFKTLEGKTVNLPEFIRYVSKLNWPVFSEEANQRVRNIILDVLASSYTEPYEAKGLTPPVAPGEARQDLSLLLKGLSTWHRFISDFLEANIWSDFHREKLAEEFKERFPELHAALVDRNEA